MYRIGLGLILTTVVHSSNSDFPEARSLLPEALPHVRSCKLVERIGTQYWNFTEVKIYIYDVSITIRAICERYHSVLIDKSNIRGQHLGVISSHATHCGISKAALKLSS